MTVRHTNYVAASDMTEAWYRYEAGLSREDRESAWEDARRRQNGDRCDPQCKFVVWEVNVDIHVDEGPEKETGRMFDGFDRQLREEA